MLHRINTALFDVHIPCQVRRLLLLLRAAYNQVMPMEEEML
jgi:hypothetical protein